MSSSVEDHLGVKQTVISQRPTKRKQQHKKLAHKYLLQERDGRNRTTLSSRRATVDSNVTKQNDSHHLIKALAEQLAQYRSSNGYLSKKRRSPGEEPAFKLDDLNDNAIRNRVKKGCDITTTKGLIIVGADHDDDDGDDDDGRGKLSNSIPRMRKAKAALGRVTKQNGDAFNEIGLTTVTDLAKLESDTLMGVCENLSDEEESTRAKKSIATYFKERFNNKAPTWETDIVDDISTGAEGYSSDPDFELPKYGNIFREYARSKPQISRREYRNIDRTLSDNCFKKSVSGRCKEQVLACAMGTVTSNFAPLFAPETASDGGQSNNRMRRHERLRRYHNHQSISESNRKTQMLVGDQTIESKRKCGRKPNILNHPTLSNPPGEQIVKSKISRTYSYIPDNVSDINSTPTRSQVSTHRAPLHLPKDNLSSLMRRNLVATLIGAYIIISLAIIVFLVLPYLFGTAGRTILIENDSAKQIPIANSFKISSAQKSVSITNKPLYDAKSQQQIAAKFESKATQTDDKQMQTDALAQPLIESIVDSSISTKIGQVDSSERPVRHDEQAGVPSYKFSERDAVAENNRRRGIRLINQSEPLLYNNRNNYNNRSSLTTARETYYQRLWNVVHNQQCQPLKVSFCSRSIELMYNNLIATTKLATSSGSSSNTKALIEAYDKTLLPNQFTLTRQSQIDILLQSYEPVLDIKCYPLMPLFLCSIFAPKCIPVDQNELELYPNLQRVTLGDSRESEGTGIQEEEVRTVDGIETSAVQFADQLGLSGPNAKISFTNGHHNSIKSAPANNKHYARLVPPCRSLCKESLRKCMFFFEVLSLKILELKDCDALPESSDPKVCLGNREQALLEKLNNRSQDCPDEKFQCHDGGCIPKKWRCDGFADCNDRSDENKCSKCNVDTEFYCGQEICINKQKVCNGIRDCLDGRDERQCLRLSQSFNISRHNQVGARKLEVWSAVKDSWLPVCGNHWSAMPMSHEACQILGYSRANVTLFLFGPQNSTQSVQEKISGSRTASSVKRLQEKADILISPGRLLTQPRSSNWPIKQITRSLNESTRIHLRSGGWFDVATSTATYLTNTGSSDSEQIVTVLEDLSGNDLPLTSARHSNRASSGFDHVVLFEREATVSSDYPGQSSMDLATIEFDEHKLQSISSMLYHGAQVSCLNEPADQVSNVHLQCQDFQCGRSMSSYSNRVRQQQRLARQRKAAPSSLEVSRIASEKSHRRKNGGSVDIIDIDDSSGSGIELNSNRVQKLEALEAFNPVELSSKVGPEPSNEGSFNSDAYNYDTSDHDKFHEDVPFLDKLTGQQTNRIASENAPVSSRWVVGGIESIPGEFPYLAALHGGPDEVFFCGGVLISINWLLTAAHCVGNRTQPEGWMVKVGVTRRIASPAFVRKLKIRKIIKHPDFNHGSLFNNDIALILLEESVEFNQYLRPICLPRPNLKLGPDSSRDCVVVGFGKSKFSHEANYVHVAHFVNVPIVRHSVCSSWYAEHFVNLTEGMLCAGYAEGKRDACQGDSGSGLFCRHPNTNQFFVAGVVSFGIKCANPKLPGVYTSVPSYVEWVESTTRQYGYPITKS